MKIRKVRRAPKVLITTQLPVDVAEALDAASAATDSKKQALIADAIRTCYPQFFHVKAGGIGRRA